MIERLAVVGPYQGASGYDRVTREFVRQFVALGVDVHLQNLDGWSSPMPDELRESWFDGLVAPNGADTVLHFVMPSHMRPQPGARNGRGRSLHWIGWRALGSHRLLLTHRGE